MRNTLPLAAVAVLALWAAVLHAQDARRAAGPGRYQLVDSGREPFVFDTETGAVIGIDNDQRIAMNPVSGQVLLSDVTTVDHRFGVDLTKAELVQALQAALAANDRAAILRCLTRGAQQKALEDWDTWLAGARRDLADKPVDELAEQLEFEVQFGIRKIKER